MKRTIRLSLLFLLFAGATLALADDYVHECNVCVNACQGAYHSCAADANQGYQQCIQLWGAGDHAICDSQWDADNRDCRNENDRCVTDDCVFWCGYVPPYSPPGGGGGGGNYNPPWHPIGGPGSSPGGTELVPGCGPYIDCGPW